MAFFFIRFTYEKESDFNVILMIFMTWLSCKINDLHEMKIWKNTDESQKHAGLCPFHHQKWHFFHFCHHFSIGKISWKWCTLHHFLPCFYFMGGERKRGRPGLHCHNYIAGLINNDEPSTIEEIRKTTASRESWSKVVVACKPRLFAAEWWWWRYYSRNSPLLLLFHGEKIPKLLWSYHDN